MARRRKSMLVFFPICTAVAELTLIWLGVTYSNVRQTYLTKLALSGHHCQGLIFWDMYTVHNLASFKIDMKSYQIKKSFQGDFPRSGH
jgi:hypothetical protein